MADKMKVYVYFGKEHSVSLSTDNVDELLRLITEAEGGWFTFEGYTFNRRNIDYVKVSNPKKAAAAFF